MSSIQPSDTSRVTICIAAALLSLCACTRQAPTDIATASPVLSSAGGRTATLSWERPRRNLDGSVIKNLAGYVIYYGKDPANLTGTVKITDPFATTYTIDKLSPGVYYFRIAAYTDTGSKSDASPMVAKTIR
jgi:hypothetical protein